MYLGEMFKHELRESCKFCCPCTGRNYICTQHKCFQTHLNLIYTMEKWSKPGKNQITSIAIKAKQAKSESGSSGRTAGQPDLNVQAEVYFLNYSNLLTCSSSQKSKQGCSLASWTGCRYYWMEGCRAMKLLFAFSGCTKCLFLWLGECGSVHRRIS